MKLFKYNLGSTLPLGKGPYIMNFLRNSVEITDTSGKQKQFTIGYGLSRCLAEVVDNDRYHYRIYSTNQDYIYIKIYVLREFLELINSKSCPIVLSTIIMTCGQNYYSGYSIAGTSVNMINEKQIPIQDCPGTDSYLQYVRIKPFKHQLANVDWMINIENMVSNDRFKLEFVNRSRFTAIQLKDGMAYLDPVSNTFYTEAGLWNSSSYRTIPLKGGVLADEVGLGKTLSIVLLVLSSKFTRKPKIKVVPKLVLRDPNEPRTTPLKAGTLVICPRRLVGQWVQEISKYTSHLSVLEISSMTHVNKYTSIQIATADIVVVPSSMFNNAGYIQSPKQLSGFNWTRLVVDEGHEFIEYDSKKRAETSRIDSGIYRIPSKFRWSCTGTPFPHGKNSLNGIISYLSGNDHNHVSPYLSNVSEYHSFLGLVCRRNTHKSTKEQISIPPYQEHVIPVDFTRTERAIYENARDSGPRQLRQLCTNINVAMQGTGMLDLNQVNKVLVRQYQNEIAALEQDNISTTQKIELLKQQESGALQDIIDHIEMLEETNADSEDLKKHREERNKLQASIKSRLKTAAERIASNDAKIKITQEKVDVFRNLDAQNMANTKCPILGTKLTGKFVITREGQYYSYDGLNMMFIGRDVVICPITGAEIRKGSYHIVDPTLSGKEAENISIDRIKWGSKLAKVMETLKVVLSDPMNRVIIFSQWDTILQLMAQYLRNSGINYVTSQGHCHQISCSINKFKTDNATKVLLLSSESANSGTNLTAANHIFLIDAVDGTPEEARAVEAQAIGRAVRLGQQKNVQVYRFIVRDTIEEHGE